MPCIVVLTLLLNKKEQSVKSNGQQAQFFQNKGGVGVNAASSPCCPLLPSCAGRRLLCRGAAAAPGLLVAPSRGELSEVFGSGCAQARS